MKKEMKKDSVKIIMDHAMPKHTAGTFMRRYSQYEILTALEAEENMPYALFANAEENARKTVNEDPAYAWVLPYLREQVEKYRNTPIELPTFQAYANFDRVGERHQFDAKMYALRVRLSDLALAVLLDIEGAVPLYEDALYA